MKFLHQRTPAVIPRGFTLVEMIVSVAIFAIVMTIALGALLAMSESDRKAQTLKSVINNLNFSIDSMSRSIRTGYNYHCGPGGTLTAPLSCGSPATYLTYKSSGLPGIPSAQVTYCRGSGSACSDTGTAILRKIDSGAFAPITSSEVKITALSFYVTGAETNDGIQPKVTILISGEVQANGTQKTLFNLQTTVTERLYDQ